MTDTTSETPCPNEGWKQGAPAAQKTGIVTACYLVPAGESEQTKADISSHVEKRLRYQVNGIIAASLADGRQYVVQILPMKTHSPESPRFPAIPGKVVYEIHALLVLLKHQDCEIGECCHADNFDVPATQTEVVTMEQIGDMRQYERTRYGGAWERTA